jgi:type IV secretion system protein VirD4
MWSVSSQGAKLRFIPHTEKGGRLSGRILTMKRFLYTLSLFLSRLASLFSHAGELHHARFARVHELSDILTDSLPTNSLLLGLNNFSSILHVRSTKERRELGNCLVVAPTRGGKGLLAVSQLLTWKHSVIVNDIKGDLFDQTAGYRRTLGKVYVVDPDGIGNRYDPLLTKRTEKDLLSAATHLLYRPDEGEGRIFTERATVMLTQLLLAAREEHAPPFPFVRQMVRLGLPGAAKQLFRISSELTTQFLEAELDEANFDDRFLLSSWGTLSVRMRFLLTDSVVRCLTGTDFTAKDVMCSEEPVTVYLRWPERDLLMLSPLVRLLWESLVNELIHTYDAAKGQSCRPVLLLIDEAGQAPIPNLQQYAATVAGRGISLWVAIQALSQLDGLYGRHKADTIRNNCDSKIFYRQASLETAEYVERSLGRRSGYAHSQTLHSGEETSESLGEQAVSLLTTQDINQLNHDEIIGWHSNRKPFRAHRMDWRAFPVLRQRRSIPPPPLLALPQLEESLPTSPWRRGKRWRLTPIDPDAIN